MTKTLTEDPSEFVRLVLTLFILGPIGSPDYFSIAEFEPGEKVMKFEDCL